MECFYQEGTVMTSQRWRSVVVLGKWLDKVISMMAWRSVKLCPGCCTGSLQFLSIFSVFQGSVYMVFSFLILLGAQTVRDLVQFLGLFSSYFILFLSFLHSLPSPSSCPSSLSPFRPAWVGEGLVFKTSFRFDDLLGLTELRKAVGPTVMVHYSERNHIKISKGKGHRGESREARPRLPVVLASGNRRQH